MTNRTPEYRSRIELRTESDSSGDIEKTKRLWHELEKRANPSFFLSSSWIETLLDSSEFPPNVVVARTNGEVAGLGLLFPNKKKLFGVTWPTLSLTETGDTDLDAVMIEENGFLAERSFELEVTNACLRHIVCDMLEWRELFLGGIGDLTADALKALSGPLMMRRKTTISPFVDLGDVDPQSMRWLSANTRQQIRRALRLYGRRGEINLVGSRDLREAKERFREMEELHKLRWADKSPFLGSKVRQFHDALLTRAFPLQQADILRVCAGAHLIGMLYIFFYGGEAYVYQNGFEYENDGRLKPGLVCHLLAMDYCAKNGIKRYRLLAGSNRYKQSLATHISPLHWIRIRRPHPMFYAEALIRNVVGR